jgi:hypothetical protein
MKTLYQHFDMLCFTERKLPWYYIAYKYILYAIVWLHQGIVYKNWS